MKIAVLRERKKGELRVAATPDPIRKYIAAGAVVAVETGAGTGAAINDTEYEGAGASISSDAGACVNGADIVLKVQPPEDNELALMPEGAMLVGMLDPYSQRDMLKAYNHKKISAFALELLPRISRAQAMDVLSSQSNLAGYRAVIDAVSASGKVLPMMMTAAGTIAPAKALVLGAGVAGLQAIATAKRLGAVVSAFDVRPAVKEQVESLGAKFIEVPAEESGEAGGGYAKEMNEEYKRKQSQLIADTIKKQDMVISTALIPGKPAPVLITEEMVPEHETRLGDCRPGGGVWRQLPFERGDKVVMKHGVILIGYSNMPSRAAVDASQLYARNLYNFVSTLLIGKERNIDVKWDDELVAVTLLTRNGETVHKGFI